MARLICQFLANLDNNKKLPNSIKIEPIRFKILQITKSSKKSQRLLKLRKSAEISPNLVTLLGIEPRHAPTTSTLEAVAY